MAEQKIIAVVGATGAQGGGLVDAILADKSSEWKVRAITRDAGSERANALRAAGAEVVAADIDNVDAVTNAFDGAHGAFCVTFYWAHLSPERENADARNLATAAKRAGVKHAVWSTLEDTRQWVPLSDDRMPTLMGKYKIPHFDAKGEMDHVFTDLGVPTTFMLPSFYWENLLRSGPKRRPDGSVVLAMPLGDEKLAGIAAADIGKLVFGIFKRGTSLVGERIGAAGEQVTGKEMAAGLSKALGEPVRYESIPPDALRSAGFPGAEDLGNMFQFYRDFADVCNANRDVARSRALAPDMLTFDEWAARNASKIAL